MSIYGRIYRRDSAVGGRGDAKCSQTVTAIPRQFRLYFHRMMPSESELWRLAKRLVDLYGEDAEAEAVRRADAFKAAGDFENSAIWNRILGMVAELLRTERENGEREH